MLKEQMVGSMSKIEIHVGTLADMGKRFAGAWNRAAAAGDVVQETHVTFLDIQTLLDTLSPKRLELLRYVRSHEMGNVRDLAEALARDYKNVHTDVAVLESAGLLVREGRKLRAPWDEVQATVSLSAD
jgi:predicted transcriptional regulator